MKNSIILVGFMGCGKTVVGSLLAERLNWDYLDTDQEIEEEQNRTIQEIFAEEGEPGFRKIENLYLRRVSGRERLVLSTGGGAVKDSANVQMLKKSGFVVYLKGDADTLTAHLTGDMTRPLLNGYDGTERAARVANLLLEREPGYAAAADCTVLINEKSPEQITEAILAQFLKK